jgi:ferredoxin
MITIELLGQRYQVPADLTILRAYEWAGFRLTRGVGCRGGFCGACGTVYRLAGSPRLYYALACQTVVQPGMALGPISYFPVQRPAYRLNDLAPGGATLLTLYPEISGCLGCNTCTKACPQGLDTLGVMAAALRGDLAAVAETSFDCIQCGMCVARCPAELAPPQVALLARRLYASAVVPPAEHLLAALSPARVAAARAGVGALTGLSRDELAERYAARVIEP